MNPTIPHTPGTWRIGDAGLTLFGPKDGNPAPAIVAAFRHRADAAFVLLAVTAYLKANPTPAKYVGRWTTQGRCAECREETDLSSVRREGPYVCWHCEQAAYAADVAGTVFDAETA